MILSGNGSCREHSPPPGGWRCLWEGFCMVRDMSHFPWLALSWAGGKNQRNITLPTLWLF